MAYTEDFLAFIDVESTGLEPGHNEITEIATIVTDLKMNEVARFESKIQILHPERFSEKAKEINGYDEAIWKAEAKSFQTWKNWFARTIPKGHVAIPVGHNVGYDVAMIRKGYYLGGAFCPLSYHIIDTVSLSMVLRVAGIVTVPDVKLTTMTKALGIKHDDAHRAMCDNEASKSLFGQVVELVSVVKQFMAAA